MVGKTVWRGRYNEQIGVQHKLQKIKKAAGLLSGELLKDLMRTFGDVASPLAELGLSRTILLSEPPACEVDFDANNITVRVLHVLEN